MTNALKTPSQKPTLKDAVREDFSHTLSRAEKGDQAALELVKEFMCASPSFVKGNDIAANAERALLDRITGQNQPLGRAIFEKRQAQLREELGGGNVAPLEALLIQRVSICWLQVYHADWKFAEALEHGLRASEYAQKYQDRAHKRFLSAVKALAQVRRLQQPSVMVNIAEKQINVQQAG